MAGLSKREKSVIDDSSRNPLNAYLTVSTPAEWTATETVGRRADPSFMTWNSVCGCGRLAIRLPRPYSLSTSGVH